MKMIAMIAALACASATFAQAPAPTCSKDAKECPQSAECKAACDAMKAKLDAAGSDTERHALRMQMRAQKQLKMAEENLARAKAFAAEVEKLAAATTDAERETIMKAIQEKCPKGKQGKKDCEKKKCKGPKKTSCSKGACNAQPPAPPAGECGSCSN